ncbi:MAG: helix-turn-helix domain-containing protein [Acidiferrobacter sp.]
MLKKRDFTTIQDRLQQGISQKDAAARLGVHPKTIRQVLQRGNTPKGVWPKRSSPSSYLITTRNAYVRPSVI